MGLAVDFLGGLVGINTGNPLVNLVGNLTGNLVGSLFGTISDGMNSLFDGIESSVQNIGNEWLAEQKLKELLPDTYIIYN